MIAEAGKADGQRDLTLNRMLNPKKVAAASRDARGSAGSLTAAEAAAAGPGLGEDYAAVVEALDFVFWGLRCLWRGENGGEAASLWHNNNCVPACFQD